MRNGVQWGHHEFIWVGLVRKRNWVIKLKKEGIRLLADWE